MSKADKEERLKKIISTQFDLIKFLQDAVDKMYGENVVRIERVKEKENKKQLREEATHATKES